MSSLPPSLDAALTPNLPPSISYIPNFISPAEEARLLHHINTAPLPTWRNLSHRRLQCYPSPLTPSNALLSAPLPKWLSEPVIPRLLALPLKSNAVREEGKGVENVFSATPHQAPNHCLVNEYKPGQGISAHEDGGAYAGVVCTVSLGSHIVLDVQSKLQGVEAIGEDAGVERQGAESERKVQRKWRILQEPRSLLVTTGDMYSDYLHGIAEVVEERDLNAHSIVNWDLLGNPEAYERGQKVRETRISLTFRDVIKTKSMGKALSGWIK